jgi:predicted alpha-1,6-mannanase (GH76 family)
VSPRSRPVKTAPAPEAPADRDRLALEKLLTFFRPRNGSWKTPTGEAWQPALALEAVLNAYERTRDPGYLQVVEKSFTRYRGRRSRYFDDDGWYLNAWLRAYDVTGDVRYLHEAESLFTEMTRGWDDVCRGGLWWSTDRDYKNAITNELFLLAAARLCRRVPQTATTDSYQDWAGRTWRWFDASGMINDGHLVNDGLDRSCANNGGVTWSYNQGVILSALVELSDVTGERGYLDLAGEIADAAIATLVSPEGILREPGEPDSCGADGQIFKGAFVQGLARLYRAGGSARSTYWTFLNGNADSLWRSSRSHDNGIGLCWAGPAGRVTAATQAAASLLLSEVALLHADLEPPVKPPETGIGSAGSGGLRRQPT